MTYELSSSFSKENRLEPSTSLWSDNGSGNTQELDTYSFFGTSVKMVPHNSDVYTIIGNPGSSAVQYTDPANQGSVYIYRSSSSGIDEEAVIGPGGDDSPLGGVVPSNYIGIDLGGGRAYNEDWDQALFGKSVAAISSSDGLHIAIAAPGLEKLAGRIFLFHSSSGGIQMDHWARHLTGSQQDPDWGTADEGVNSHLYSQAGTLKSEDPDSQSLAIHEHGYHKPNDGVSLALDESEENLYISFYDSVLSDSPGVTNVGGIRLYKSSSVGGVEHLKDITAQPTSEYETLMNRQFGSAHKMIVADGKVYIAASSNLQEEEFPYAYLFEYDVATGDVARIIYYQPNNAENDAAIPGFGTGTPDIVSGSDGIYVLQGNSVRRPYEEMDVSSYDPSVPTGVGRLFLFKRTDSEESPMELHSYFTGSNDEHEWQMADNQNYFGGQAQLMSGTSGFVIVASEWSGSATTGGEPRVWVYETGSSTNNAYYIDKDNSTQISDSFEEWDPSTNPFSILARVGKTVDAKLSNDGKTLHMASADSNWNMSSGAVLTHEWKLVPRTVSTVAVGGGVGQSIQLEDASISVPETALASSTEITVEKKTIESVTAEGDTEVSDLGLSSDVVVMTPHGLTFDEPVTVTLTVDPMPANPVVYYQSSPGSAWEVFSGETTIEGNTIS
jgi:hypothetical protein